MGRSSWSTQSRNSDCVEAEEYPTLKMRSKRSESLSPNSPAMTAPTRSAVSTVSCSRVKSHRLCVPFPPAARGRLTPMRRPKDTFGEPRRKSRSWACDSGAPATPIHTATASAATADSHLCFRLRSYTGGSWLEVRRKRIARSMPGCAPAGCLVAPRIRVLRAIEFSGSRPGESPRGDGRRPLCGTGAAGRAARPVSPTRRRHRPTRRGEAAGGLKWAETSGGLAQADRERPRASRSGTPPGSRSSRTTSPNEAPADSGPSTPNPTSSWAGTAEWPPIPPISSGTCGESPVSPTAGWRFFRGHPGSSSSSNHGGAFPDPSGAGAGPRRVHPPQSSPPPSSGHPLRVGLHVGPRDPLRYDRSPSATPRHRPELRCCREPGPPSGTSPKRSCPRPTGPSSSRSVRRDPPIPPRASGVARNSSGSIPRMRRIRWGRGLGCNGRIPEGFDDDGPLLHLLDTHVASGGDPPSIYVGDGTKNEGRQFSPDGAPLRIIRRTTGPVPITRKWVKSWEDGVVRGLRIDPGLEVDSARSIASGYAQVVEATATGASLPFFVGLHVDTEARLWVQEYSADSGVFPDQWSVLRRAVRFQDHELQSPRCKRSSKADSARSESVRPW